MTLPQVSRLAAPGSDVLILGAGGKSGLVTSVAARRRGARVIGIEPHRAAAAAARRVGACEVVLEVDASQPMVVAEAALAHAREWGKPSSTDGWRVCSPSGRDSMGS
jgi:glycine/D-amino acid oxidase-like deaminating enzyme